ncbi:SagB/ThcOx family dehydrogenase [Bacillus cereus group sp. N21]|uniref:SagB/ThcOx family dehydrogenase n=1 Tax=Bacillus cereus group sp. N21 TaxID=2794591 RepID=UPI0018F5196A|nr:SagB/ThcOx family dehydrogenase [Bacillus cereus group sp. N21]MBJ8030989.1 SagB/ThcOx family dehydrogenase [Bacillus cereus group sp. N21]
MQLKTAENILYFWKDGHFMIDDYIRHEQYSLEPSIFPVLNIFKEWVSVSEAINGLLNDNRIVYTQEQLEEIIETLLKAHILIKKGSPEEQEEFLLSGWKEWGASAKYFHFNTRLLHKDQYLNVNQDYERLLAKKENALAPSLYKMYVDSEEIPLPLPNFNLSGDFLNTLLKRQTVRSFSDDPITVQELSTILYLVWGAHSCKRDIGIGKNLFKTSPSGGARHPIEVYPYIFNVKGIKKGLYHYNVKNHSLDIVRQEDISSTVIDMAAGQEYVKGAAVLFFYTACLERPMWKYKSPRVYRIVMMDVGHLSQTFYLVASWLQLGAFFTAHANDELVEEILELNKESEIVCGISGIGNISREAVNKGRDFRFKGEI